MSVKTPNTDDVFSRFINKTSAGKLEKLFAQKNVKFEKGNISAAESVTNVDKSACFFFRSKIIQPSEGPTKFKESKEMESKKLVKVTFYNFHGKKVDPENWKDDDEVPFLKTIEKVKCPQKGCENGKILCQKCKGVGQISCSKCKGKGHYECKACKGTGKIELKLNVKDEKGNKVKEPLKISCKACYGAGKTFCATCAGTGKENCKKCKGERHNPCKKCAGEGGLYKYKIGAVPFAAYPGGKDYEPHLFFRKELEKKMGEELDKVITKVDGVYVRSIKDMNEKWITPQLGVWNSDIANRMKDCSKEFKELDKSRSHKAEYPIYVFPIFKLDVTTPRGKSFRIFSVGTERGYSVFSDL